MRRLAVALLVLGLAGCSGASDDASPRPTSRPPLSLDAYAARRGDVVAHSPDAETAVVVTAHRIDVVHRAPGTWATVASLDVSAWDVSRRPVEVRDLTGDGRDDYLVPMESGSAELGVVVTDDGTRGWRLVHGEGMDGPYFARAPRIDGNTLVTVDNDCVPSCADGTNTDVRWRWAEDRFVRAG